MRKFQQLSYNEVDMLKRAVEAWYIEEDLPVGCSLIYKELKDELEIRG